MNTVKTLKKLSILSLASGIIIGLCFICITYLVQKNDENTHKESRISHLIDQIDSKYNYYKEDISQDVKEYTKNTFNSIGEIVRKEKYRPYYFIGGFFIFLAIGGSIALYTIGTVKENKLKKTNKHY